MTVMTRSYRVHSSVVREIGVLRINKRISSAETAVDIIKNVDITIDFYSRLQLPECKQENLLSNK